LTDRIKLEDVARLAGVSVATASRVVNGSRHPVSEELMSRVREAVEKLGYVPNAHAQALAGSTTGMVGLIVHDGSDPYFAEMARGVIDMAYDAGLLSVICNTLREPAREVRYVAALHRQRVRAIVMLASGYVAESDEGPIVDQLDRFQRGGGRVVTLGERNVVGASVVLPDHFDGGRRLTRSLLDLGHTGIGVIGGPESLRTVGERLDGVKAAFAERDLSVPEHLWVGGDFTRDSGYNAARQLLQLDSPPTAIIALNDIMAIGALAAARDLGISVPEDLSLTGFDDISSVSDTVPPLTTVRIPLRDIGRKAMELALNPAPQMAHFSLDLIMRESVAVPSRSVSRHANPRQLPPDHPIF
jgi:LacI family transcriptional regulator